MGADSSTEMSQGSLRHKGERMSSAEATVDETVAVGSGSGRGGDATRAAMVLALIALAQLAWLGALVYGGIRLLT